MAMVDVKLLILVEALTKGTFCTSRGKQCLHIKECAEKPLQVLLVRLRICLNILADATNVPESHGTIVDGCIPELDELLLL